MKYESAAIGLSVDFKLALVLPVVCMPDRVRREQIGRCLESQSQQSSDNVPILVGAQDVFDTCLRESLSHVILCQMLVRCGVELD